MNAAERKQTFNFSGVVLGHPRRVVRSTALFRDSKVVLLRFVATVVLAIVTQAPSVRAEIVDTDALSASTQVEQDRASVRQFIDNATVKEKLQALGVSGVVADDRLAALSPTEIHALAERIDAMPAGGRFSDTQIIIVILLCILVAVIV